MPRSKVWRLSCRDWRNRSDGPILLQASPVSAHQTDSAQGGSKVRLSAPPRCARGLLPDANGKVQTAREPPLSATAEPPGSLFSTLSAKAAHPSDISVG